MRAIIFELGAKDDEAGFKNKFIFSLKVFTS